MVFVTAGFETTATTMGVMMYYMAKYPEAQEKVFDEVSDICGDNDITYDTIKDLVYLDAFIDETLRLKPPVIAHFRSCVKDCTIKGIPFKKGTNVQLGILPAHMDPELFPEPEKFQPERFLKENADNIQPYSWRPFGAGPRVCIGQRLAVTEMKLFMAKMIREFRIYETPKTNFEYTKGTWFFLSYDKMYVGLEPRLS